MIKKPFEQWLFEEVEEVFGINRIKNHPNLLAWLAKDDNNIPLTAAVCKVQDLLNENVEVWNEDELKMMFIAPLLSEINFNKTPQYKVFTQRFFSLQTEEVETQGRIEWLVSTGKQIPKKPFFFLHEYKPEKGTNNDPLGQLLIGMVTTQKHNKNEEVLYGCYVLGRFWFFVVLLAKEYSVSRAYDATQSDELNDIVNAMEKVKVYIERYLELV